MGISEDPETTTLTRSVAIPTSAPSGNCRSSSIGTVGEIRCFSSRLVYPWLMTQNTACDVIPKEERGEREYWWRMGKKGVLLVEGGQQY